MFFLCEEIVCFNEKCVVRQLAMETTSMFRVSMGLGEEPGPSADGEAQHLLPRLPWDGGSASSTSWVRCAPGGQGS